MKINFCTLFDSNYIDRGLLMYRSLISECPDAFLYIIAFDDICYNVLKKMNLKKVKIISLKEFEDEKLLIAKKNRNKVEYMWTCSSSSIYYILKKYNVSSCTYVDADLYFYSNPKLLIDEMKDNSVLISKHRYTKKYDQSKISGKYCVQFMTFKNNAQGLEVLNWWRNACIDWCYAKPEDGKFGDQKYLDDWTTRFEGVHVMENIGGGVAPWNMQQYFIQSNNKLIEKKSLKKFKLVFFHFHGIKFINNKIDFSPYFVPVDFKQKIIFPYLKKLINERNYLISIEPLLFVGKSVPKTTLKGLIIKLIRIIRCEYNVVFESLLGD